MARRVRVRGAVLAAMIEHARRVWPLECCGLLAGDEGMISEILPAANALASSREYSITPEELIAALRSFRERGLTHLGIYHSHPQGENTPSRRDIEMSHYPSCAHFIVSPYASARALRAFEIRDGGASELEVEEVLDSTPGSL